MNRKKIIYDLFNLENKTVVLTGSSGRLGTQYANILSASGANVVLVDKEIKQNKKLEQKLIKKYIIRPKNFWKVLSNLYDLRLNVNNIQALKLGLI